VFDKYDGNKNGLLNYAEAKEFLKEITIQLGESWDQKDPQFDQFFNKIQKENKVSFEVLYKSVQQ